MSIRDSIYTSPDALRARYRNPKNPLANLEDVDATKAAVNTIVGGATGSSFVPGGSDPLGGGGAEEPGGGRNGPIEQPDEGIA